jgi:hypothetical protein
MFMKVAFFWDMLLCGPYMKQTFRSNASSPSSGSMAGLMFDREDGYDTLLRNVGPFADYTALYPRRWQL